MTPNTLQLQRNVLFRSVNLAKGNPFLSLRAIPFLIVLASFALLPAVRAQVVKTIPVGPPPDSLEGIAANPKAFSEVYVADLLDFRVGFINTISNTLEGFLDLGNEPVGLTTSPDGLTLYITEDPDFLEAISLVTFDQIYKVTVNPGPAIPAVTSDNSTVYVPCQTSPGTVVVVGGPNTGKIIKVGGKLALDAVFTADNSTAYVTTESKQIAVIDTATAKVTGKINTLTLTFGLAINGTTLYAAGINNVYVIDTTTNTITNTIKFHGGPDRWLATLPAVTPDGAFLYVPVAENLNPPAVNNIVLVIDTSTNKIVQTQTVGNEPIQVACAANDIYGYSSNVFDGTVSAYNLAHPPPGP